MKPAQNLAQGRAALQPTHCSGTESTSIEIDKYALPHILTTCKPDRCNIFPLRPFSRILRSSTWTYPEETRCLIRFHILAVAEYTIGERAGNQRQPDRIFQIAAHFQC